MEIFILIWFCWAATIILGGGIVTSIYKGYAESKNRHLSSSDEENILFLIMLIAGIPITLSLALLVLICQIPFYFGKLLGKYL